MAGFLGNQPSAVPLTSADIADGTITNDDLAGSITDAKISALSASKLTGSIADARVPSSAVTQHVTATDLAPVRSDILKLAIHSGIDGNRAAFNLDDSFIDTFEDDTGITTETNVDRDATGEYVNSIFLGTSVYVTGDRRSTITATSAGSINPSDGAASLLLDGDFTSSGDTTFYGNSVDSTRYVRFQFDSTKVIDEAKFYQVAANSYGVWKWQGSDDASTWTDIGASFTLGGVVTQTITTLSANTTSYLYYQILGVSGTMSATNFVREFEFKTKALTTSATGTLISDPQTASTSRTSASGVIIYEDADGTNTLGTDLKIYFSCNNSAWTEASSYGTATTYSGTKKLVKLGATTCTAGTSVAMKAEWANQAASIAAKTITINGQVQHDTAQKKFDASSLIFDGTTDSLEIADHSDFSFGTGNFTIDFWMRTGGAWGLAHQCTGTASTSTFNMWLGGAGAQFYTTIYHSDGSNFNIGGGANLNDNVWHHLAVVRNGSAFNIYVDGTSTASSSTAAAMTDATRSIFIGDAVSAGSGDFNGHIEDFRISNTARWTSNFSVPTSAHATDANTLLLIGSNTTDGSTVITDATGVTGKEARLHGWAVNY